METNELNYFESYEDIEIHELMLRDSPRNEAYRKAIEANKDYIQNKIVLDVGSGTGILSVLCAQAGASKVYAVEASNYAAVTKEVAAENKFEDIIEVINKRIEDTELPEKVDIIVSEWMGFYLLHEGMLDSVIYARDQFLKPDGCLFPQVAKIYAVPCSMPSMFEFWDNVHGISMQSVGKISRLFKSLKPEICVINSDDVLCDPKLVRSFDLKTIQIEDLNDIQLIDIAVASKEGTYQGFCLWFDVEFPNFFNKTESPTILSTSPNDQPTHWKQSVVILPQEIEVEEGTPIAFEVKLTRCEDNIRRYNIEFALLDPNEVEHPMGCDCFMTKCIVAKVFVQNQSENTEIST